jgi:hypothetical protein
MSEARTEDRLGRLEHDVAEIKSTLVGLVPLIIRIDERLNTTLPQLASASTVARIEATLPYVATKGELMAGLSDLRIEINAVKVELADKPGKMWLATAIGLLIAAYAVGLAGLVVTKLVSS